jgi:hypothetical protein
METAENVNNPAGMPNATAEPDIHAPAANAPEATIGSAAVTNPGAPITPHSPAAEALPNHGASGVIGGVNTLTTGAPEVKATELPLQATQEAMTEGMAFPKNQNPNDVKFKVKHSPTFKGTKTFEEGSVQIISKESADQFTKLGMGSVIK